MSCSWMVRERGIGAALAWLGVWVESIRPWRWEGDEVLACVFEGAVDEVRPLTAARKLDDVPGPVIRAVSPSLADTARDKL